MLCFVKEHKIMKNFAEKQVNTKVIFDISLFNKCIDVIEKLYNTGAENTETDTQRAYFCPAIENTIIVKQNKKDGKEIATFPKKECFEYLASNSGDTASNSGDTANELLDNVCTLYKNTFDTSTDTKISFRNILQTIKNGAYKNVITKLRTEKNEDVQKQIKTKELKAFSISGHCSPKRNIKNFVPSTYTNLIQIDVDFKDNQHTNFDVLRKKFIDLEFVFTCFTSPRGTGLKALVLHNLGYEKHEQAFEYFEKYFFDNFNIIIDKQCKNLDRICYVSFDENLYLNENCKPLHIDLEYFKEVTSPLPNYKTTNKNNFEDVFQFAEYCTNKQKTFMDGQKSIYRVLFAKCCYVYGASEDSIINYVLQHFPSVTSQKKATDDAKSGIRYGKNEQQRTFTPTKEAYNKAFEKSNKVHEPNKKSPKNSVKSAKNQNQEEDFEFSEDATAKYLAKVFQNKIVFAKCFNEFYIYDLGIWNEANECQIRRLFFDYLEKTNKTIFSKCTKNNTQKNIIEIAKSYLFKDVEFDKNDYFICLKNGVFDLQNNKLISHSYEHYITNKTNIDYDTTSQCPIFEKFLNDTFLRDGDVIKFIQRLLGLCLSGKTIQKAFFFQGGGNNGKSVLLNVFDELLQGFYFKGSTQFTKFKYDNNDKRAFVGMENKRLIVCGEWLNNAELDTARIKSFTGQEKVECEPKFKNSYSFIPKAKVILFGNDKPIIKELTNGIWKRFVFIPFLNQIEEHNQNENLFNEIKTEISGVLNFAIKGFQMYQSDGINVPKTIETATKELKNDSNILVEFLENFTKQTNEKILFCDFFKLFESFVIGKNSVFDVTKQQLNKDLKDLGYKIDKGAGNNLTIFNLKYL